MGNLTIATIFIVMLNVLMWMTSLSMMSINPTGTMCYNLEGSIIDNTITSTGDLSVVNNQVLDDLPVGQGSVTSGITAVFTDIFNSVISWFKTAPGLKYIYGVVAAPYNILKCMNLPSKFIAGIGTFWYLVTFLVLITYLWRGD